MGRRPHRRRIRCHLCPSCREDWFGPIIPSCNASGPGVMGRAPDKRSKCRDHVGNSADARVAQDRLLVGPFLGTGSIGRDGSTPPSAAGLGAERSLRPAPQGADAFCLCTTRCLPPAVVAAVSTEGRGCRPFRSDARGGARRMVIPFRPDLGALAADRRTPIAGWGGRGPRRRLRRPSSGRKELQCKAWLITGALRVGGGKCNGPMMLGGNPNG